jgi:hypothetical protein
MKLKSLDILTCPPALVDVLITPDTNENISKAFSTTVTA